MNSATQTLAFQVWKLEFIKISFFSFMDPGHYCLAALIFSFFLRLIAVKIYTLTQFCLKEHGNEWTKVSKWDEIFSEVPH